MSNPQWRMARLPKMGSEAVGSISKSAAVVSSPDFRPSTPMPMLEPVSGVALDYPPPPQFIDQPTQWARAPQMIQRFNQIPMQMIQRAMPQMPDATYPQMQMPPMQMPPMQMPQMQMPQMQMPQMQMPPMQMPQMQMPQMPGPPLWTYPIRWKINQMF